MHGRLLAEEDAIFNMVCKGLKGVPRVQDVVRPDANRQ
jgi:hypothetical protein